MIVVYGRKHEDIDYFMLLFDQWMYPWCEIVCDETSEDWNLYLVIV